MSIHHRHLLWSKYVRSEESLPLSILSGSLAHPMLHDDKARSLHKMGAHHSQSESVPQLRDDVPSSCALHQKVRRLSVEYHSQSMFCPDHALKLLMRDR